MTTKLFRVFIGPSIKYASDPYAYDWQSLVLGNQLANSSQKELLSSVTDASTTIDVTTGTDGWPAEGGLWMKDPDGGVLYADYDGLTVIGTGQRQLQNVIVRGGHPEQPSSMPIGGIAAPWYLLSDNDGRLEINWISNDEWSYATWKMKLSGVYSDANMLTANHLVAVEMSSPTFSGGQVVWSLEYIGILTDVRMSDDYTGTSSWTATVEPCAIMHDDWEATPHKVGNWNIGDSSATARVDSYISYPLLEHGSSDVVDAEQTFGGNQAVDGDEASHWISNGFVGVVEDFSDISGLSEVYFAVPEGIYAGMRYIEGVNRNFAGTTIWVYDIDQAQWFSIASGSGWLENDLSGGLVGLMVQREDDFEQVYQSASYDELRDCQSRTDTDVIRFLSYFRRAGGAVAMIAAAGSEGVMWGSVSSWPAGGPAQPATTSTLAACPGIGYAMRHNTVTDTWEWTNAPTPGRLYVNEAGVSWAWIVVELPPLNRKAKEAASAGTSTVYIIDESGTENTGGLPNVNGEVVIDGHIYTVTGKYADRITVSPVLQDAVEVNTPVYTWFEGYRGAPHATDAYPIRRTEIVRPDGSVFPRDFSPSWSQLYARSPDRAEWDNDYHNWLPDTEDNTSNVWGVDHPTGTLPVPNSGYRVTTFAMPITAMGNSSGFVVSRAKVTEIRFYVDPDFFETDQNMIWEEAAQSLEETALAILASGPFGASGTVQGGFGSDNSSHTTERGPLSYIVSDLMAYGCSVAIVQPSSKTYVTHNGTWTNDFSSITPTQTYTDVDLVDVDIEHVRPFKVSDVQVEYELPDGEEASVNYPDPPWNTGKTVEAGPFFVDNVSEAERIAQNIFYRERFDYAIDYELADADLTIRPFNIHEIQWSWGAEKTTQRRVIVRNVNHLISGGHMITTCSGDEVARSNA